MKDTHLNGNLRLKHFQIIKNFLNRSLNKNRKMSENHNSIVHIPSSITNAGTFLAFWEWDGSLDKSQTKYTSVTKIYETLFYFRVVIIWIITVRIVQKIRKMCD